MTLPTEKSFETNNQTLDFQQRIDTITNRSLSAETIDSYADMALESLIAVIEDIVQSYRSFPTLSYENGADEEVAALDYFGMDSQVVDATLDHIARLSHDIALLDDYIKLKTRTSDLVIMPPDETIMSSIEPGSGTFGEKKLVPRMKVVLLLLKYEYDVDLDNEDQVRIIPGITTESMMREEPYNIIDVPAINRVINVCDEKGNATFIFDREKLLDLIDIDPDLARMTKSEVSDLIMSNPAVGTRVVYSTEFSARVNAYLSDLEIGDEQEMAPVKLLKVAETPNGEKLLSVNAVSLLLFGKNTKRHAVGKAVEQLGDSLGEVYHSSSSPRFNSKQVDMISQRLAEMGYSYGEVGESEDNLLTMHELKAVLTEELGLDHMIDAGTITSAINGLGDELKLEHKKGAGKRRYTAYTYEEKDIIKQTLWERLYKHPILPEGFVSVGELATIFKSDRPLILRAIDEVLGEDPDERYRMSNGKLDKAVTLRQKDLLEEWLDQEGYIWPEGYVSAKGAADKLQTTAVTIQRLASLLIKTDKLASEDILRRMNTNSGSELVRYSPRALEVMADSLGSNLRVQRAIARKTNNGDKTASETIIPTDWVTISGIGKGNDLDKGTVRHCAQYLFDQGKINRMRDGQYTSGDSYYYSPEDAALIVQTLRNKPPEGWLSQNTLKTRIGLGGTAKSIFARYSSDAAEFWYMGEPMMFYPPSVEQQIVSELGERPPEDWVTVRMLRSRFGGSMKLWEDVTERAHAEGTVSGGRYRGRQGSTLFYSPDEQDVLVGLANRLIRRKAEKGLGQTALK